MSTSAVLRREQRPLGRTRRWTGVHGESSAMPNRATSVRHLARRPGDTDSDVVALAPRQERPIVVVSRLWMGVLSMFVLIVGLGLVGMVLGSRLLGYRPVVVTTSSMEPSIRPGDVVITRRVDPGEALGAQTVINFADPDGSGTRLHRIVEVTDDGYRTKGDANPTSDSVLVPPESVTGAGLVLTPFAGYLPLWIDQGKWGAVVLTLVGLVAAATMSRRSWMWATDAWRRA